MTECVHACVCVCVCIKAIPGMQRTPYVFFAITGDDDNIDNINNKLKVCAN